MWSQLRYWQCICLVLWKVSMFRIYHTHTLQTNPRHHEEGWSSSIPSWRNNILKQKDMSDFHGSLLYLLVQLRCLSESLSHVRQTKVGIYLISSSYLEELLNLKWKQLNPLSSASWPSKRDTFYVKWQPTKTHHSTDAHSCGLSKAVQNCVCIYNLWQMQCFRTQISIPVTPLIH